MSFTDDFADLLPDTFTVEQALGQNAYGDFTFAAPTTVAGRLVATLTTKRDIDSQEDTTSTSAILATTTITVNSRVSLTGHPTRIVRSVNIYRDENNLPHHCTVQFV